MNNSKMTDLCYKAQEFGEYVLDQASGFDYIDWSMYKCCLISIGVLLGSGFASFFRKLRPLIWVAFIVTYLYTMWRLLSPLFDDYLNN